MIIKWDNYTSANQYTVKIEASDGSDTREVTTDTTFYRFDNLQYDMEYNISLSSSNTQSGLSSKPFTLTTTTLDFPTSLITPSTSDLIDIQARVRWAEGVSYDKLRIIKDEDNEVIGEVDVTAEDNAAAQKIIGNIEPKPPTVWRHMPTATTRERNASPPWLPRAMTVRWLTCVV